MQTFLKLLKETFFFENTSFRIISLFLSNSCFALNLPVDLVVIYSRLFNFNVQCFVCDIRMKSVQGCGKIITLLVSDNIIF